MATPDVTVDIADFLTGTPLASKSGYLVNLSEAVGPGAPENPTLYRQGYTDSSGVATLVAVTPGTYTLRMFGVGVSPRVIVVPDESGPLDAADLSTRSDIGGNPNGRLTGVKDQPYYDEANGIAYICLGGTVWQELVG